MDATSGAAHERLADPGVPAGDRAAAVGLTGKPQTGKEVVADDVKAHYADLVRFAFSDAIPNEINAYLAPYRHVIDESNKSAKEVDKRVRRAWDAGARLVMVTGIPSDV